MLHKLNKSNFWLEGGYIFTLFVLWIPVSSPGGSGSQGDKQTDIGTYRLNRPRGQFSEKGLVL